MSVEDSRSGEEGTFERQAPAESGPPASVEAAAAGGRAAAEERSGGGGPSKRRWLLLLTIALSVLVVDQVTKFWAVDRLTKATRYPPAVTLEKKVKVFLEKKKLERIRAEPVVIHPDHLRMRYVENPGAAWGMLSSLDDEVRIPFFYVVSLLALAFLTVLFSRLRQEQRLLAATFALILGGALGNFLDRILRGYVIDFIDVHWRYQHHFPTFNVADVAISVGLIGLFLEAIFGNPLIEERAEEKGGAGGDLEAPAPVADPEPSLDAGRREAAEEGAPPFDPPEDR